MIVLSYIELTKRINNVLILMKTKYKNKINHRRHSLSTLLDKNDYRFIAFEYNFYLFV